MHNNHGTLLGMSQSFGKTGAIAEHEVSSVFAVSPENCHFTWGYKSIQQWYSPKINDISPQVFLALFLTGSLFSLVFKVFQLLLTF